MPVSQKSQKLRAPDGVMTDRPIALDLPLDVRQQVEQRAKVQSRSVAATTRLLALEGLAAYERNPSSIVKVAQRVSRLSGRPIGLRMLPAEHAKVSGFATADMRPVATFARLLVLVALQAAERSQRRAAKV